MDLIDFRGFFFGFRWVHDGRHESSRTSALIAAHHPRWSITWRWALYWLRPGPRPSWPHLHFSAPPFHGWRLTLWRFGSFDFKYQRTMPRSPP